FVFFFFFFQAEDGIRDFHVTGVQTCALPIFSIFMPAIMGIIADRWIPVQRLLGYCHALAAFFIISAGYYGYTAGSNTDFATLFSLYSLSVAFYMPTIALSNSVAYTVLTNNNYDTIKAFPPIRTMEIGRAS